MTWGGWSIFLTELDPRTGLLKDAALRALGPELRDHPPGAHTEILSWAPNAAYGGRGDVREGWEGDALSSSGAYMEGPALFRHADSGAWFALGSYGWLVEDYTIRVCRRDAPDGDPRGPFLDKDGLPCTVFDAARDRYGASMLVAQEGNHTVPGHPHVWREGDAHYLGYDYRPYSCTVRKDTASESDEGAHCDPTVAGQAAYGGPAAARDVMGIRRLRFVDGWPTIWTPLTVSFVAGAEHDGAPLEVVLESTGAAGSVAAFDRVAVSETAPAATTHAPSVSPTHEPTGEPTAPPGMRPPTHAPSPSPRPSASPSQSPSPTGAPTRDKDTLSTTTDKIVVAAVVGVIALLCGVRVFCAGRQAEKASAAAEQVEMTDLEHVIR